MGDVFISWENEALLAVNKLGKDQLEIVIPSISILAEPPVTVIDVNTEKHGTRNVAEAYLNFLYTKDGQELCAQHFYRPRDEEVIEKYSQQFPQIEQFKIDTMFGGWQEAQKIHFMDGGTFDQIYQTK